MSGYVEAGYAIALASLGGYAVILVGREKAAARRLGTSAKASVEPARPETDSGDA